MADFVIYTDGGYSNKHNVGAFAYVMLDGDGNFIRKGAWKITNETNNRAELKAIITAVYHLFREKADVVINSDSMYAINTLSGKWARNANTDLFDVWDRILKENDYKLTFNWVKGHNGNEYNEMCDKMCSEIAGMDLNAEFKKYKK